MDPMGNVPVFVSCLAGIEPRRARKIIVRELLIALAVLVLFLFAGSFILAALQVSEPALGVSGGVILFLIAIKMVFADVKELFRATPEGEPFIVPLAVPFVAGPSAIASRTGGSPQELVYTRSTSPPSLLGGTMMHYMYGT